MSCETRGRERGLGAAGPDNSSREGEIQTPSEASGRREAEPTHKETKPPSELTVSLHLPAAMVLSDGKLVALNAGWRDLWGDGAPGDTLSHVGEDHSKGNELSRNQGTVFPLTGRLEACPACVFSACLRSKQLETCTGLVGERTFLIAAMPQVQSYDRFEGVLLIAVEVSDEEQRYRSLQWFELLDALARYSGRLAHDMNNLLAGILGYATLLSSRQSEEAQTSTDVDVISKTARKLASLAEKLSLLGQPLRGEPTVLNLNLLVKQAVEDVMQDAGPGQAIGTRLDPSLWPVRADGHCLRRVLADLMRNGLEAMSPEEKILVSTENRAIDPSQPGVDPLAPEGGAACVVIQDSGRGMTPEEVRKAFLPLSSTKTGERQAGFGLSHAYAMARFLGGTIDIQSEPGRGTTVTMLLPAASSLG